MNFKFAHIPIILLCMLLLSGCLSDCDPAPPYFRIIGIRTYNFQQTNSRLNPQCIRDYKTIRWDALRIVVNFDVEYFGKNANPVFVNPLEVNCLQPGFLGDLHGIKEINIITLTDYNNTYYFGNSINSMLSINDKMFLSDSRSYWNENADQYVSMHTYLNENSHGVARRSFSLKLTEPPTNERLFAVRIFVKLNNGDEFSVDSYSVVISE